MSQTQTPEQAREFYFPPRQTSRLLGRFGAVDLAMFAAAIVLLVVALNLLPAWGWLIALGIPALILLLLPLPRPAGGRPFTDYLGPAVGTVWDKLTGRNVYRGAVFAPDSLKYRMDLPADLAGYRMISVPARDGVSRIGLMVNEAHPKHRTAAATMLTSGQSLITADEASAAISLDGYEAVLESWCQRKSGIGRYQVMVRTAPDVINQAARHVYLRAPITSGPVWENTRELVTGPAASAVRQEIYVVIEFDLSALSKQIEQVDKNWGDEAIGGAVRDLLLDIETSLNEERIKSDGWLRPGQYAALIHTQFDPDSMPLYDMLGAVHKDLDPRLAGPSATERSWKHYRHDSALSQTIWVHEMPGRPVRTGWLRPVLGQTGVQRTVSLVAQPLDALVAQRQVQRQSQTTGSDVELRQQKGMFVSARKRKEVHAAAEQDQALAGGDGFFRYQMFITVTAATEAALHKDVLSVQRRLTKAYCQSVVLYGEQDQAFFAGALPLARGLAPLRGGGKF